MTDDLLRQLIAEVRNLNAKPARAEYLSVTSAAKRLPMRREVAVQWLHEQGLVHTIDVRGEESRMVVSVAEMDDAVRSDGKRLRASPPKRKRSAKGGVREGIRSRMKKVS